MSNRRSGTAVVLKRESHREITRNRSRWKACADEGRKDGLAAVWINRDATVTTYPRVLPSLWFGLHEAGGCHRALRHTDACQL